MAENEQSAPATPAEGSNVIPLPARSNPPMSREEQDALLQQVMERPRSDDVHQDLVNISEVAYVAFEACCRVHFEDDRGAIVLALRSLRQLDQRLKALQQAVPPQR